MLRENGFQNPYYFARDLRPALNFERNGQKPMRFDGSIVPGYEDDACEHFHRASDSMAAVGINCAYLGIEIVQTVVGIDLAAIHPLLPEANTGAKYDKAYKAISRDLLTGKMPQTLNRDCIIFDANGELLGISKKKASIPSPKSTAA